MRNTGSRPLPTGILYRKLTIIYVGRSAHDVMMSKRREAANQLAAEMSRLPAVIRRESERARPIIFFLLHGFPK